MATFGFQGEKFEELTTTIPNPVPAGFYCKVVTSWAGEIYYDEGEDPQPFSYPLFGSTINGFYWELYKK